VAGEPLVDLLVVHADGELDGLRLAGRDHRVGGDATGREVAALAPEQPHVVHVDGHAEAVGHRRHGDVPGVVDSELEDDGRLLLGNLAPPGAPLADLVADSDPLVRERVQVDVVAHLVAPDRLGVRPPGSVCRRRQRRDYRRRVLECGLFPVDVVGDGRTDVHRERPVDVHRDSLVRADERHPPRRQAVVSEIRAQFYRAVALRDLDSVFLAAREGDAVERHLVVGREPVPERDGERVGVVDPDGRDHLRSLLGDGPPVAAIDQPRRRNADDPQEVRDDDQQDERDDEGRDRSRRGRNERTQARAVVAVNLPVGSRPVRTPVASRTVRHALFDSTLPRENSVVIRVRFAGNRIWRGFVRRSRFWVDGFGSAAAVPGRRSDLHLTRNPVRAESGPDRKSGTTATEATAPPGYRIE